jgi:hypothetical protein
VRVFEPIRPGGRIYFEQTVNAPVAVRQLEAAKRPPRAALHRDAHRGSDGQRQDGTGPDLVRLVPVHRRLPLKVWARAWRSDARAAMRLLAGVLEKVARPATSQNRRKQGYGTVGLDLWAAPQLVQAIDVPSHPVAREGRRAQAVVMSFSRWLRLHGAASADVVSTTTTSTSWRHSRGDEIPIDAATARPSKGNQGRTAPAARAQGAARSAVLTARRSIHVARTVSGLHGS